MSYYHHQNCWRRRSGVDARTRAACAACPGGSSSGGARGNLCVLSDSPPVRVTWIVGRRAAFSQTAAPASISLVDRCCKVPRVRALTIASFALFSAPRPLRIRAAPVLLRFTGPMADQSVVNSSQVAAGSSALHQSPEAEGGSIVGLGTRLVARALRIARSLLCQGAGLLRRLFC